jgi:hypothetical protein
MEVLDQAIKRVVEEVVYRDGVVRVSAEAKRLAAAYPGCGASEREIADALMAEAMRRSNVALLLGGTGRSGVEEPVCGAPELGRRASLLSFSAPAGRDLQST